jgi:hypothetical protein
MSRDFLDLKRDIQYFLEQFGQWVSGKGLIVDVITIVINTVMKTIQQEIEEYVFEFTIIIITPRSLVVASMHRLG